MTFVLFASAIMWRARVDLIPLISVFLIQLPIVLIARIGKEWLKTLKGGLLFALIIFITNILSFYFFKGGHLTSDMIEFSLALTVRFLALITSFSIFFLTTSPDKLSLALDKARIPFEFNFAFITAIRFVPVLADEAQSIMDAQRSRGLELDKGNLLARIRKHIPVLLPLIINSIRRSLELAEAMESRAFGATKQRTSFYELTLTGRDYLIFIISILFLVLSLYIRFFIPPLGALLPSFRIV